MHERTAFRLAMLKNGYQPLLNDCKRPIEKGWPRKTVDEAEILAWDRSALASTGMKIDGDLAVIDADIREQNLINALADALDRRYPALFAHGLVRHAGGVKQAWFVRTAEPFRKIHTRKWTRGAPDDPQAETQHVECFSSLGTRQFGIDGPHARAHGAVVSVYQFTGGASPATTPRAALPVMPKAAFAAACNLFEQLARDAGLAVVKTVGPDGGKRVVYDLTDAMVFESDRDTYRGVEALADAGAAAVHDGYQLRVTSSFLGHGTNATKCIVGYSKVGRCVFVHDFETGLTHKPAQRAAPVVFNFLEQLRKGRIVND